MATTAIDSSNFAHTISQPGIQVLDFWAPWCAPCTQFSPVFEDVSNDHDDVVFGTVNVDDNQELAKQFEVQTIPTLVVFKDGEPVYQEVGGLNRLSLDTLVRMIK